MLLCEAIKEVWLVKSKDLWTKFWDTQRQEIREKMRSKERRWKEGPMDE